MLLVPLTMLLLRAVVNEVRFTVLPEPPAAIELELAEIA